MTTKQLKAKAERISSAIVKLNCKKAEIEQLLMKSKMNPVLKLLKDPDTKFNLYSDHDLTAIDVSGSKIMKELDRQHDIQGFTYYALAISDQWQIQHNHGGIEIRLNSSFAMGKDACKNIKLIDLIKYLKSIGVKETQFSYAHIDKAVEEAGKTLDDLHNAKGKIQNDIDNLFN